MPSASRIPASDSKRGEGLAKLAEVDANLLELVDRLERLLATSVHGPAMVPLDRGVAVNRESIRALDDLRRADRRAAEREVHLLTMPEALDRFGYPDRTGPDQNKNFDMWWTYDAVDGDGQSRQLLVLYFTGGLVLGFHSNGWD